MNRLTNNKNTEKCNNTYKQAIFFYQLYHFSLPGVLMLSLYFQGSYHSNTTGVGQETSIGYQRVIVEYPLLYAVAEILLRAA